MSIFEAAHAAVNAIVNAREAHSNKATDPVRTIGPLEMLDRVLKNVSGGYEGVSALVKALVDQPKEEEVVAPTSTPSGYQTAPFDAEEYHKICEAEKGASEQGLSPEAIARMVASKAAVTITDNGDHYIIHRGEDLPDIHISKKSPMQVSLLLSEGGEVPASSEILQGISTALYPNIRERAARLFQKLGTPGFATSGYLQVIPTEESAGPKEPADQPEKGAPVEYVLYVTVYDRETASCLSPYRMVDSGSVTVTRVPGEKFRYALSFSSADDFLRNGRIFGIPDTALNAVIASGVE